MDARRQAATDTPDGGEQAVVLAAIRDNQGRYLVSLRKAHLLGGSHWEFPGGKVEPGESLTEALTREVREEVSLDVTRLNCLRRYSPPRAQASRLSLYLFETDLWRGRVRHNLGQPVRWCTPAEIAALKLLPASVPLLDCLYCAPLICITPAWAPEEFSASLCERILQRLRRLGHDSGERVMLLWRQPHWDAGKQTQALQTLLPHCRRAQIPVAVARCREAAEACRADFIHFSSAQLRDNPAPALSCRYGAAVHDRDQLARAHKARATWALISPVLSTPSKPGARPLGWQEFTNMARDFPGLAYALGGMAETDLIKARASGGFGVAGITCWWL